MAEHPKLTLALCAFGVGLALIVLVPSAASAENIGGAHGAVTPSGTDLDVERADHGPVTGQAVPAGGGGGAAATRVERATTFACLADFPGNPNPGAPCEDSLVSCPPDQPGPRMWLWSRELDNQTGQVLRGWQIVGWTCAAVPGGRPALTRAHLQSAFTSVPWAKLSVSMQPPNGVTLVSLPVFYQAQWAAEGISPGETIAIDPARMLGYHVDLRPVLVGYTFHFGDDTSFGPTRDPGGTYPDGGVTHAYPKAGAYAVRIEARLSAEFRIEGGSWTRIPDEVSVPGAPATMQVKTARAVLVT